VTGDWQEDWEEHREPPASSRGRHSRRPEDYGSQDPYAPADRYPQPDPYATPDPYGEPDPYAGPDRPGPADPYGPPDRPGPTDTYPAPDRSATTDPFSMPGRPSRPDPLTAPGRFAPPDPLTAPGRHGPDRSGVTDPYATRPHRVQPPPEPGAPAGPYTGQDRTGGPAYDPPDEPGRGRGRRGSAPAPPGRGDQNGRGRRDSHDPLTAPQSSNGYGPPGPYDAPAPERGSQNGFGPPGSYDAPAPERGSQNGYGTAAYARPEPDDGPFRWRPPSDAPEQEGLAPLPDYQGGPDREPRPAPRDRSQQRAWNPEQERDWDPAPGDGAPGLADPVSGPADPRAWQRGGGERDERDERNEPRDWDQAPQGDGIIPGFGDTGSRRGGRGGRPRRRISRVLAPLLALVLLVALGAGGYKLYRHFQSPDFSGPGTGEVTVQVLTGDTATSLAPRLVKAGVVASTSSFISAAKSSSNPSGLEPGFFRLRHHMNSAIAYALLINPSSRIQSVVTVPEGLRETEILATLEQKTGTSASAFTAALKNTAALGLPSYANGKTEGYLFPATYDFNPGTSALTMLKTMVASFNHEASSINLSAAAKTAQLTPNQVITVASILEAEAGAPKYYADVAEVIYNRLNLGMPLELDSTVNYALHRFGVSLTQSQLEVNSPYNTFIHKGLPPGPIDSPGNAAIEGALHPAHGPLLYFVTVNVKTGLTKFATTAAGFQQLENECNQNNSC
jgi:UPF0755 protein